jgi:hypothetical protein
MNLGLTQSLQTAMAPGARSVSDLCANWGSRVVWRLRANRGDGIVCDGRPGRTRTAAGSREH